MTNTSPVMNSKGKYLLNLFFTLAQARIRFISSQIIYISTKIGKSLKEPSPSNYLMFCNS